MNKVFMLNDLQIYIAGVASKEDAVAVCWVCRMGVTTKDLIEVEKVPDGVPHYTIASKPRFDPHNAYCIDMAKDREEARENI